MTAMAAELTIGEVARRAGLRTSALRYYEDLGLLPATRRVSGRRRYTPDALARLAVIRLAQHAGFTMAEIVTLVNGFAPETPAAERWRALAEHKLIEVEARIRRGEEMKRVLEASLRCGCLDLADCPTALELGVDVGFACDRPAPVADGA
jgi:MerR family redox-sensitive transcriptional activator SoxR